jgi:hypothetical protein
VAREVERNRPADPGRGPRDDRTRSVQLGIRSLRVRLRLLDHFRKQLLDRRVRDLRTGCRIEGVG